MIWWIVAGVALGLWVAVLAYVAWIVLRVCWEERRSGSLELLADGADDLAESA